MELLSPPEESWTCGPPKVIKTPSIQQPLSMEALSSPLSSRAYPDFLLAALQRAACAVFCKENRMKIATPPTSTGNPGQPRDLQFGGPFLGCLSAKFPQNRHPERSATDLSGGTALGSAESKDPDGSYLARAVSNFSTTEAETTSCPALQARFALKPGNKPASRVVRACKEISAHAPQRSAPRIAPTRPDAWIHAYRNPDLCARYRRQFRHLQCGERSAPSSRRGRLPRARRRHEGPVSAVHARHPVCLCT